MKSFLERLGIYGYAYVHERAMLASILTGTPVLFIGHIGEAKTKAAEMMAALLDEPFQKIAADKAQFEDMVGFPNPKSLMEGEVDYVKTKLSIWEKRFLLIDEISRCNPQTQNKLLEIVLDRQLMGLPTDIRWVWATMNPLDYPGSQPLDGALAGRMGYVIQVKKVIDQPDAIIERVVSSRNYAQTPALAHWTDDTREYRSAVTPELKLEMQELMFQAGQIFTGLDDHWTPIVSKYVTAWSVAFKNSTGQSDIDGRRMVMLRNNIIANIAIATVQYGHALSTMEIKEICAEVLPLSIPWLATGISETFDVSKFKAAHKVAAGTLDAGDTLLYRIVTEQDPIEKVRLFLSNRKKIDTAEATNLISSIYNDVRVTGTDEEIWKAHAERFMLKVAFTWIVLNIEDVPSEVIGLSSRNYPIKLCTDGMDTSSIKLQTGNYTDTIEIFKLYKDSIAYTDPVKIAAAYFTFHTQALTLTSAQLTERYTIAIQAADKIRTALMEFHPKAVHVSPPAAKQPSLSDAAVNALQEILSSQNGESHPDGSGTGGDTEQVGGLTLSV
jgi:hypothetical protein